MQRVSPYKYLNGYEKTKNSQRHAFSNSPIAARGQGIDRLQKERNASSKQRNNNHQWCPGAKAERTLEKCDNLFLLGNNYEFVNSTKNRRGQDQEPKNT